ncbi:MAG TPA: hypothetical protein VKT70_09950 [Stellaceae bacterium]|nr:hypothetical protein [Stellaceae bacterium]
MRITFARIAAALVVVLLAAVPAAADTFKKDNWSLDLPEKWALDTYRDPHFPANATIFSRNNDDYPKAIVWALPPETKLRDPRLADRIFAIDPTRALPYKYNPHDYRITKDSMFQHEGHAARRIDFVDLENWVDSAVFIEPGRGMPLMVLDVKSSWNAGVNCGANDVCTREEGRVIAAEIEHMLASFRVLPAAGSASVNPSTDYFAACAAQYRSGNVQGALDACDKAIKADPRRADAYFIKGSLMLGQGKLDAQGKLTAPPGTAEALKKYLELTPNGAHADEVKQMLASIGATVETTYGSRKK